MPILITGGSGFLGRRGAAHFRERGFEVLTPSHRELDITDAGAVMAYLSQNRPRWVLHCAAVSDTGLCARDPEGTAKINTEGPENLARGCAQVGARLIFCSSDQVYSGAPNPGPHREEAELAPNHPYARQKLLAERLCGELCDTVSLRLSWMYAREPFPGDHGDFLRALRPALKDPAAPLSWPIHDRRGITPVETVVENLEQALSLPAGIYNFGCENDGSTYDTLRQVLEELELEEPLSRLKPNREAFAAAPRDIRMDATKCSRAGITFPTTREALRGALK